MTTNVQVRVGAEYTGRPAFNSAKKDVTAFESSLNLLQKRMATVFSIYAISSFGKASLNAFTQDNLAAKQLNQTLTNLGLAFDSKRVADYIQQTEKLTGVLDEQLRPALGLLLRTTGSVTRAEQLLNTSLNISKATGKDLTSVTSAISRAYYGNYTALQRLGIGINVATLKGKDWQTVQDQLNKTFAGAATTAANSYQGSIDKLKVSVDNAKEAIGKGMVDALQALSSSGTLATVTSGIERLGSAIGNTVGAFGRFIAATKLILTTGGITQEQKNAIFGKPITEVNTRGAGRAAVENANARAAAEKKVADQLASQAKSAKATLDTTRAQLALRKTQSTFDLQAAEIAAALKNKSLTPEEVLRLNMMQAADALSNAIQDNQSQSTIDKLTDSLVALQNQLKGMQAINPFQTATDGAIALTQAVTGAAAAFGLTTLAYQSFRAGERGDTLAPNTVTPNDNSVKVDVTVHSDNNAIIDYTVNQSGGGAQPFYNRNSVQSFPW